MLEERVQDVRETELQTSPSRPEDFLHDFSQSQVVAKFGVSRTTASRWHRALTAKGLESLRKGKASGRPSRLTPDQKAQIAEMFQKGDSSFGFSDGHWTAKSLARVIEERFSVYYSLDHVARLLAKLGPARKSVRPRARGED